MPLLLLLGFMLLMWFLEGIALKFFFWSLENAGYVDHVATFSECLLIAIPLALLSTFLKADS